MQHLLLLHGAIGAKDQFELLAANLKERFIIHRVNFNGHGGEAFATAFSIPAFAEEVHAYIQQHQLERVSIFGYSMGGYVAMHLAKHHPEMVGKIITLATKFHWDEATAEKEVKMLDAATIEQKIPAFAKQLEARHQPNDWKMLLEKTKQMLLEMGRQNPLQLVDYKSIPHPCLLLLGDKDKMITLDETLAVQHALPNAIYSSLPGTPHPIEQVNPEMLASFIIEFVN